LKEGSIARERAFQPPNFSLSHKKKNTPAGRGGKGNASGRRGEETIFNGGEGKLLRMIFRRKREKEDVATRQRKKAQRVEERKRGREVIGKKKIKPVARPLQSEGERGEKRKGSRLRRGRREILGAKEKR